ncbi:MULTISPECIES: ornithine cyclodeaminase family protein [unclassified Blastococcus]
MSAAGTVTVPFHTEDDVRGALDLPSVIEAVESVLVAQSTGLATTLAKTMTTWAPASSAHALGAVDLGSGLVAFKTWVNTPQGASATVTAYDATDGALVAAVSAGALGALRTAAVSAVATRWLSAPDADELALLGTGRQALGQVRAVRAVRPLRRVRVWGRDPGRRTALAERVTADLGVEAVPVATVPDAVAGAPVVTLVTRAAEPVLPAGVLAEGAHLNAVGAILPANAEFEPGLLAAARLTVVDDLDNARRSSRELREFYGDDWSPVHRLADVVTGAVRVPGGRGPTVFKGLGTGLADLAAVTAFLRAVRPGQETHP